MKTSNFQKYFRGTAACTNRLTMDKKGFGQLKSIETYFSDTCFSGVEMDQDVMADGVDYCDPEETSHKGFCLATL